MPEVYEEAQMYNQVVHPDEKVNRYVLIGFGRMPNDPPGGNAWLEVWASRHARDRGNADALETVKLGWASPSTETVRLAKDWLAQRPDLVGAELAIAGGNQRELRL